MALFDYLIGTEKSPGVLENIGTTGEQLGDAAQAWRGLLGPSAAVYAPAPPEKPATSPNATVPPRSGLSAGGIVAGVVSLVLIVILYVKGR